MAPLRRNLLRLALAAWVAGGICVARAARAEEEEPVDPDTVTGWIMPMSSDYRYPWGLLTIERASGTYMTRWEDANSLTGNWGGARDELRRKLGISIEGNYLMESAGNPVGGEKQGVTYAHDIFAAIIADLGVRFHLPGVYFLASASDRAGGDLSSKYIGNVFTAQQIYGGETIRLAQLALGRRFLEGKVDVVLGRINALDDFFASPLYCNALNAAFCGNPFSMTEDISISSYPFSQWGARVRWLTTPVFSLMLGTYNAYGNFRANGYHGVDFSIRHNSGVIAIAEAMLRPYVLRGVPHPFDLPGHFKLGGYFDNEPLTDFHTGLDERGTWGMYLALDQQISGEVGEHAQEGLSIFTAVHYAPPDVNAMQWFADVGFVYDGLFPTRDEDIAGFFVAYGEFSSALRDSQIAAGDPSQTYELVLELNYDIAVLEWLSVQPDIQGILHPGGTGEIPNALVLGLQIVVPF